MINYDFNALLANVGKPIEPAVYMVHGHRISESRMISGVLATKDEIFYEVEESNGVIEYVPVAEVTTHD